MWAGKRAHRRQSIGDITQSPESEGCALGVQQSAFQRMAQTSIDGSDACATDAPDSDAPSDDERAFNGRARAQNEARPRPQSLHMTARHCGCQGFLLCMPSNPRQPNSLHSRRVYGF